MKSVISRFTILVERRRLNRTALTLGALLAAATGLALAPATYAQTAAKQSKVAKDLDKAAKASSTPAIRWARDVSGKRHVQVVISSLAADPEMTELRQAVIAAGGSVHVRLPALRVVTATLPAAQLDTIAARADVSYVAPNRVTQRTASVIEQATNTLHANVRSNSTKTSYSGLDGSGIGIAVLDSGVMRAHEAFNNASAATRVAKNVTMLGSSQSNWTTGQDLTSSPQPGSVAQNNYDNQVANDNATIHDGYGHGTHVASVAAGRPVTYGTAPDLTGIAPGAKIIDVQVLGADGAGTLSDVLEGIQWAIYNAKAYNIRVLNLSLWPPTRPTAGNSTRCAPRCAAPRPPASPSSSPPATTARARSARSTAASRRRATTPR